MNKQTIPYANLDTPVVLIDLEKLMSNIREMTELARKAKVKLRPHTKVHQSADIAEMQIAAGACGVEVGNVPQAEAMVKQGIHDIVIAHPFVGHLKFERLKGLLNKPAVHIAVVVDMIEQAEELSRIGKEMERKVPIHLKIDTGINRYGVLPGKPALEMAKKLSKLPGVVLSGVYAHESGAKPTEAGVSKMAFEVASSINELAKMLKKQKIPLETVSVGASPTFRATCRFLREKRFPEITEIHPGQCVIGDILYTKALGNTREACALKILTAVMSTSHKSHAVIDAGYKTFGADSMIGYRKSPNFFWKGLPSFGSVEGRRDLWLGRLGAETGWVYYVKPQRRLNLGERLEIVPNNATLVMNIHDQVYGVRKGRVDNIIRITGRELGS